METDALTRQDLAYLGAASLLSIAFFSFFGRDLMLATAACVAANLLLILGMARFGL